ncbi:MAG: AraC family transcriptional regulator, partial [Myxococcota bacterium]
VSHELPVQSRITVASPTKPFRAIAIDLDLALLRGLRAEIASTAVEDGGLSSIQCQPADPEFIETVARYFQLNGRERETKLLGPILYRELHARLLLASHAGMLRRLLNRDSHASQIARAIAHIRENMARPLLVEGLAKLAGMSVRSFHSHFRRITRTTPLQYQKELRLIEARGLLEHSGETVGSAAFEVGYESPTQFSREYARRFGVSPSSTRQNRVTRPADD